MMNKLTRIYFLLYFACSQIKWVSGLCQEFCRAKLRQRRAGETIFENRQHDEALDSDSFDRIFNASYDPILQ